jgi:hypothetical protein
MANYKRLLLIVAAVSLMLAFASPAIAAPKVIATPSATPSASGSADASAPLQTGLISVQLGPAERPGYTTVIVAITLDTKIKLPARVRIPVPMGTKVGWAGEVFGGDLAKDIERSYTLGTGAGGAQYAELTLTQSNIGQIDTFGPGPTKSGNRVNASVTYVQAVPSPSTEFSVRLPANAGNVELSPKYVGQPDHNKAGESLYVLGQQVQRPGSPYEIKVSYTEGGAQASKSSQTPLIIGLLIGFALVIVALIFIVNRTVPDDAGESAPKDEDEIAEEKPFDEASDESEDQRDGGDSDKPFDVN